MNNISKQDMIIIMKKAYGYYKQVYNPKQLKTDKLTMNDFLNDTYVVQFIEKSLIAVRDYINSGDTFTLYQKKLDIASPRLQKYIDTVKITYPDIYYMYLKKRSYEDELIKRTVNDTKDILLDLSINGVEEDGVIREMDMIDYYSIAKIPPINYIDELKKNSRENVNYIKALSSNLVKFSSKEFSDKQRSEFIENAYMLKGRTLTREEKIEIISFLDQNNIPVNAISKMNAAHRLINNKLYIEEEKQYKRA